MSSDDLSKGFGATAWKGAEKLAIGMERTADAAHGFGTKLAGAKPGNTTRRLKAVRATGRGIRRVSQDGVASTLGAGVVAGTAVGGVAAARRRQGIAKRVYDDIMALDPEGAKLYAEMVVRGALQHDLETHTELLQKRVDQIVAKRAQAIQKRLATSIAKGAGGDGAVAAAVVLAKAGFTDLTDDQRRRLVAQQDRDASGRFKTMHRKVTYSTRQPMPGRVADRMGIPEPASAKHMKPADRARYQQAYRQVQDMVGGFQDAPVGSATLHLVFRNANGDFEHVVGNLNAEDYMPDPKTGRARSTKGRSTKITPDKFDNGGRLVEAQVITDGGLTAQGAAFNLVGSLTNPYTGGLASRALERDETGKVPGAERLGSFADAWDQTMAQDVNNPANRVFRRMRHGSQLLEDIAGDHIPSQAKLALRTADAVGAYGPEAQKVIGPHADRAAYRYRGVEKKPDAAIQNGIGSLYARFGPADGRKAVLYGREQDVVTRQGVRRDRLESPVIAYFKGRLADPDLIHLQRKSGVIPPSEGIIIDKNGKVVTQAVGYGDDWYLPFNLKTLSKLKGGDYIRTRTWGGLTTEDIYAGLVSGARSVTVVSHNGVYTVEFDDNFRGKRRYNDKAARMVKRYGHLLDAVKSEDVTLGDIPAPRRAELEAEAALEGGNPRGGPDERRDYQRVLEQKLADERREPQLGPTQTRALAEEFLNEHASDTSADGRMRTWDEVAREKIDAEVKLARALHESRFRSLDEVDQMTYPRFSEEAATKAAAAKYGDPESAIRSLGLEREWATRLAHAEDEYRESMSPLRLNGAGYDKAQKALEQQFPYYIANASWQPNNRGGRDYGYVKPRFNRPEGALAGYYDATILGTGKVSADQVRHQNRGVKVAEIKAERKLKPVEREEGAQQASARAQAAAKPIDKKAALKALAEEARNASTFGAASPRAAGKAIPQSFWDGDSQEAAMARLIRQPWEDILADLDNDPNAMKKYEQAVQVAAPVLGLNAGKVAAFRNPERAAKGVEFSLERAAESPHQVFDFGEDYGPNKTVEHYDRLIRQGRARIEAGPHAIAKGEDLNSYIARMQKLTELADDPAATRISASSKPQFERLGKQAALIRQAERFRAETEEKQREIEAALQHEKDMAVLDRDISFQVPDVSTARAVAGANDPRTILGSTEP